MQIYIFPNDSRNFIYTTENILGVFGHKPTQTAYIYSKSQLKYTNKLYIRILYNNLSYFDKSKKIDILPLALKFDYNDLVFLYKTF